MKELINSVSIADLKNTLLTVNPTKDVAVKWFNLRSLVNSTAGTKFTEACTNHLLSCKDCEEVVIDGMGVKLITDQVKAYNETKEVKAAQKAVDDLDAKLKSAKIDLKAAQEKAGFEYADGKSYYKVI